MEAVNAPQQQDKWSYSLFQAFTTTVQGLKERIQGKNHKDIEESYSSQSEVTDMALPADGSKEVNKQLSSNIVKLSSFRDVCELNCNNQSMLDSHLNAERFFNCDICKIKCYHQAALNFHLNGKNHKAQLVKLNEVQDDKLIIPVDDKLANDKPATAERLFNCGICKAKYYSQSMLNIHLKLDKHKAQLEKRIKVYEDRLITPEDNKLANDKPASSKLFFNCGICKVKCYHQSTVNSHLNGKKHKAHLEKLIKVQVDKLFSPEAANKLANDKPATAEQVFSCGICKAKCYSQFIMNIHLNGKRHKAQLEKLNKVHDDRLVTPEDNKLANDKPASAKQFFNCDICKVKCYHQSTVNSHLNGKKHKAHHEKLNKVQNGKLIPPKEANKLANDKPATAEQLFNCGICNAKCHSQSILNSHLNGKKHKAELEKYNKVPNTLLHHKALFNLKAGDRDENPLKVESDDDEECYEIDPIIFTRKLTFDDMDDVALVAEKWPVALRDFPHPRHLCGCLPFGTTSHESFCAKCFCCVCEVAAPCTQWRGINGHCHLSEKIREDTVRGLTSSYNISMFCWKL